MIVTWTLLGIWLGICVFNLLALRHNHKKFMSYAKAFDDLDWDNFREIRPMAEMLLRAQSLMIKDHTMNPIKLAKNWNKDYLRLAETPDWEEELEAMNGK